MHVACQAHIRGDDVTADGEASVEDDVSLEEDVPLGQMHVVAAVQEDPELPRLDRVAGRRTGRRHERHVEQSRDDNRMLRIAFHWDHQHLRPDLRWACDTQATGCDCAVGDPPAFEPFRLDRDLDRMRYRIDACHQCMTRLTKRPGLGCGMKLQCFQPVSHCQLLLQGRTAQ